MNKRLMESYGEIIKSESSRDNLAGICTLAAFVGTAFFARHFELNGFATVALVLIVASFVQYSVRKSF